MRFVEGVLRAPGQLHVCRGDGLLVGIEPGFGGDEGQRFLAGPVFDGRHVCAAGEQEIFVEIGMAEVDAVELAVEFGQIFPQREVPERPVVEPLIARLELAAGGQDEDNRGQHPIPRYGWEVTHMTVSRIPVSCTARMDHATDPQNKGSDNPASIAQLRPDGS